MGKRCPKILVLGIGNILLRDEGIGVRVIEHLKQMPLPHDVDFIDGGSVGSDLIKVLADRKVVIIIDAVDRNAPPGIIFRTTPENWRPALQNSLSLLELEIAQTPAMVGTLGHPPQRVIYLGIVPEIIQPGLTLSPTLESLVPAIAEHALEEIASVRSTSGSAA